MSEPVAVLGLGAMGGSIGRRLVGVGWPVGAYDVNPLALARFTQSVPSAQLASIDECRFVITSLPNDAAAISALLDAKDLTAGGRCFIEMSTILPATMLRIAASLARRGASVIDCPVSGGPVEAATGRLTLFVGGETPTLERAQAVLETLGTIRYVGDVGLAKAVKIVNNVMAMGNMAVAAEAFTLGQKMGLDPGRAYELLSGAGGRSNHFIKRMPRAIAGDFAPGFAQALAAKDLNLALMSGEAVHMRLPMAEAILGRYQQGLDAGLGQEDIVALVKLYGFSVPPESTTVGVDTTPGQASES